MKGFAHFMTGLAATSLFPFAVQSAAEGNPLYFILGGAFGLLPDTLDFKVYRYLYRHDLDLMADARTPDPGRIANELAGAVVAAACDPRGRRVKLNTLQCGADRWLRYRLEFDEGAGEIRVVMGPVVDTGQQPVPGAKAQEETLGRAHVPVPMRLDYAGPVTVDIFDGPSFLFKKEGDSVTLHFLPWHRSWTHSLVIGAGFGLLAWVLWAAHHVPGSGWGAALTGWKPAAVITAAYSAHILADQCGVMGSNLFYPLTRWRQRGLGLMHSGDARPNFLAVWFSMALIYANLYRAAAPAGALPCVLLAFACALTPLLAYALLARWLHVRRAGAGRPAAHV